jgi:hypothetical protein
MRNNHVDTVDFLKGSVVISMPALILWSIKPFIHLFLILLTVA